MSPKITQDELPYPGLKFATSKRGGRHVEFLESAITAGSGQYREGFLRPGGVVADSEGILAFDDGGFVFFADSGETFGWRYNDVASFKTGMTLVPIVKKFNVRMKDGSRASFRIGPQLLSNATYILGRAGDSRAGAVEGPPWRVQEGGNEAEGFFVVGYGPDPALPGIIDAPHLHGPYSLEDAQAVVAAEDPTVRPLDEKALRREEREMDKWMRQRERQSLHQEQEQSQPQEISLPPPPKEEPTRLPHPPMTEGPTDESLPVGRCTVTTISTATGTVIESVERATAEPAILYAQALLWREKGKNRRYKEAVRLVVRDSSGEVIFDERSMSTRLQP